MKVYSHSKEYLFQLAKRIAANIACANTSDCKCHDTKCIDKYIIYRTASIDIRMPDHGINILVLPTMIELQPIGRKPIPSSSYRHLISKAMDNEHVFNLA